MLLKLVYIDNFSIFSNVKSVTLYKNENKDIVLGVEYENDNNIQYTISNWNKDHYEDICSAFLMNSKGETIEKIR